MVNTWGQDIDEMVESDRNWAWDALNGIEDEPEESSELLDAEYSALDRLQDAFDELMDAADKLEDQAEYERVMGYIKGITDVMNDLKRAVQ